MDLEILRFEVQRINGTPDSIMRAINLLTEELQQLDYLPKSIEYGFFEEFSKCLVEWMARGEHALLKETWNGIQEITKSHPELSAPFAGGNSRKRLGAQLQIMGDMVEIYLRSDMEIKDRNTIMAPDSKTKRFRQLLAVMLKNDQPVTVKSLTEEEIYEGTSSKTIERDLQELAALNFIRRTSSVERKATYELTNKTRYIDTLIIETAQKENRKPGKLVPIPESPAQADNPEKVLFSQKIFRHTQLMIQRALA